MATPEATLFWGLTWANIIAFVGIVGNFFFTKHKDRAARRDAARLDTYNHSVRTPMEALLKELSDLMDEADDIVRGKNNWQEQVDAAKLLSPKFHSARRKLARHLTDCDQSLLIIGSDWAGNEQGDMDAASEYLDRVVSGQSNSIRDDLHSFALALNSFRNRLRNALETYAASLIK
jgi:hypothetical protein